MESPPYLPSHNSIISLSHSSSPWLGRTNSVAGDVHVYARRYVRSCDPLWVTISRPGSIGDDGGSRVVRPGTFPHWWSWGSKPWGLPPKMGQTCPPKKFSSSNGIENLRGELPISGKTVMFSFYFFVKVIFTIVFFAEQLSAKRVGGGRVCQYPGNWNGKNKGGSKMFPLFQGTYFQVNQLFVFRECMPFVWLISNIFFPPDPEKNLRIQKTQGGSYSVTNAHHEMIVPRGLELRNRKTFQILFIAWKNPCQVIVKSSEKMLESSMLPKMCLETYGGWLLTLSY